MSSYHIREIAKGVLGESSKIREELEELEDAEAQNSSVLVLCELADLYGAMEFYLTTRFHGEFTMEDMRKMAALTKKAFESGDRA